MAQAVDMSTKLGGRVFQPAFPVVDGSSPTASEDSFNKSLLQYSKEKIPLEDTADIQTRERVLSRMTAVCREWIRSVCESKGFGSLDAGGQLFTSGSYRLGVHEPGADIDTMLVAPAICQRSDFFGNTFSDEPQKRDPNSLAERIRKHPNVKNFVPVEEATVPILTFDWDGINIDLLFARLNTNTVPVDFDINNDVVLDGVDSATEKSLNGPRVTNLIAAFMSGTPERYQNFLTVVRCVRKWAKARGLYSNKMGYWGGVNINIAVALTVQLYPNACPASLLRKFFLVFHSWRWPHPVLLTKAHDAGYGLQVWNVQQSMLHVAPMITPAYPAMNSTVNVSRQTLQILQEEFTRGHHTVDELWKAHQRDGTAELDWSKLFETSDFFISYPQYISLCIVGPTQTDTQKWAGFVESRLRKLVSVLLGRSLPLKKIQLWPKKIEACIADRSALLTQAQRQNSVTYFIGFAVDKYRMRGSQLNIEGPLQKFRDWDLSRFQLLATGMDVIVKDFKVKELPKICFDSIYESKDAAMKKRKQLRDADPARLEKKRLAKLEELRQKAAELQKKKEDKKRKTDDVELEEAEATALKSEENVSEEKNLLESALDAMQDATREEAEAEKQKLLAGELLEADGYVSDENAVGYSKEEVRLVVKKKEEEKYKDKRSLPVSDKVAEALEKIGVKIVDDDEMKVLGNNLIPPWRGRTITADEVTDTAPVRGKIKFLEKFDMVELDAFGRVIDKGDGDFAPSKEWTGRKAGFEFKLGERGIGYYRTGKKVVVPSNTAY